MPCSSSLHSPQAPGWRQSLTRASQSTFESEPGMGVELAVPCAPAGIRQPKPEEADKTTGETNTFTRCNPSRIRPLRLFTARLFRSARSSDPPRVDPKQTPRSPRTPGRRILRYSGCPRVRQPASFGSAEHPDKPASMRIPLPELRPLGQQRCSPPASLTRLP
jgi:hypothetical protein